MPSLPTKPPAGCASATSGPSAAASGAAASAGAAMPIAATPIAIMPGAIATARRRPKTRISDLVREFDDEAVAIRHFDLGQALCIHHVAIADELVLRQDESDEGIDVAVA